MNTKPNKKSIVLLVAFCAIVLCIVSGFVAVTYSLFGDAVSGDSGNITIATLNTNVTTSLNLGILEPAKEYTDSKFTTTIKNVGNSREIFVRVKVEASLSDGANTDFGDKIAPIFDSTKWAVGGANNNEYFYLGAISDQNQNSSNCSVVFNTGFKTNNNFTNNDAGYNVTIKFTVYAIQAQYGAVEADTDGWWNNNTPSAFKTYYNSVKNTYK